MNKVYNCWKIFIVQSLISLQRQRSTKTIQQMIGLGIELVAIIEPHSSIRELNAMAILQRFINEQATFDSEKNTWGKQKQIKTLRQTPPQVQLQRGI